VTLVLVKATVEIVDLAALEKRNRLPPDLLSCSVVEVQLVCSATNVDAAATHHRPVTVVDPLMAVADEEQVVRPRGNHRPQQLQGLGTEVLGLVYNDRRIVRPTLRIG